MADNFAINQLKKYGWSQDQGLGKNSEGRRKPITVSTKNDTHGLGANSVDWSFEWWDHVYNNTLNNIQVSKTDDGDVKVSKIVNESTIPRNKMGIISTDESMYSLSGSTGNSESPSSSKKVVKKQHLYNGFVKSSTGPLDLSSMSKKSRESDANEHYLSPSHMNTLNGDSVRDDFQKVENQNGKISCEKLDKISEVDKVQKKRRRKKHKRDGVKSIKKKKETR
ncbi:4184_t:CDS:2 [Acaulospora morrowiae]|uniref:4184_t:CDS:1 n=1 Tax=Acaulospora morrowiae TaxID=94023 RepID=A0A9N9FEW0_9GLOM|nr:4184_t:CDS:2 [Acaulospora morrowiae]